jgi:hypothetical protein
MELILIWIVVIIIFVAIQVAITRWVLRINHIIERMDKIISLIERNHNKIN